MPNHSIDAENEVDLRLRALQRLTGGNGSHDARLNAAAALRVLHDLASSPETSAAALALLHELQVHQVELDMQDEELRRSRAELEAIATRQEQLYDFAPAGCFTVDSNTVLLELNLAAAGMLGSERNRLLGRRLDSFLSPDSARALNAMLGAVSDGAATKDDAMQILTGRDPARQIHACAKRDPNGKHFLIAFVEIAGHAGRLAV